MGIMEILNELYQLDPALKEREEELMDILKKLMASKPEAEADEDFKARLKAELLEKLEEKPKKKTLLFIRPSFLKAAGLAAAALALVVGIRSYNPGMKTENVMAPVMETEQQIGETNEVRQEPIEADETRQELTETIVEEQKSVEPSPVSESATPAKVTERSAEAPPEPSIVSIPAPAEDLLMAELSTAMRSKTLAQEAPGSLQDEGFYGSDFDEMEMAEEEIAMDTFTAAEPAPEVFNTEEYEKIVENDFMKAVEEPVSTFSIDVDTASYANVRRFLNSGSLPYPDAVRVEELVNYFTYDYPQPQADQPFSITTELAQAPWNSENKLLMIGLQGRSVAPEDVPPSNLVFLLDVSGSMNDANKLPLLKESMGLLIDTLDQDDRISIVAYAGAAGLVLPPTSGNRKAKILRAMDNLEAGGSTAGGQGIELAYATALENFLEGGNNRIIIATDGDFNVGASSQGELARLIESKRDQGVFLTVLGLGMGNYKDHTMETLADKGNGNYAYIDTLSEARKVLVHEQESTLFTIAKDVKVQIEFNPVYVDSYRLIGYENRVMANQDFDDDTKDAGEIGAGHSVTALYEIIPVGTGSQIEGDLRYQNSELSDHALTEQELGFVKFRYKEPMEDQSRLITEPIMATMGVSPSENLQFVATVAEWGSLLRGSEYIKEADFDRLIGTVRETLGQDRFGYRAEFLTLVYKTKELMQ